MANSAFSDASHATNRHSDISIASVASNDILKFDGTNWVNSTTSPDSSIAVTQSSHGFAVGEALKSSGSNGAYAKAQADSAANAEVVGIVTIVTDTNNFTLTLNGMVRVAGAVLNETAGTALFLSASTAGALTATEPSTSGQISKPIAIVTTANTEMVLVTYRGETISTGVTNWDVNGLELVLDADGDTSLTADTDDQIDVKLAGADDFRFTANNFNILSGSTITIDSGATITNSGTATGFGGGIASVVADTTPQLGGNLDMQARLLVGNGGSTGIAISAAGEVTMAAQPAFAAHQSSNELNVTGNGAVHTQGFPTEDYDQNSDFATPTFTAPVTGKYILTSSLRVFGNTTAISYGVISLVTSNRTWNVYTSCVSAGDTAGFFISAVADMDAADTCQVRLTIYGESSDLCDIAGSSSMSIHFAGILVA